MQRGFGVVCICITYAVIGGFAMMSPEEIRFASKILPRNAPDTVYSPVPVTDYSNCVFDPYKLKMSLLDNDGVPFMNDNGRAVRPTEVLETMPAYTLVPSMGIMDGLFDLVLDGQYLAVNTDAEMVFVNSSTGPSYATQGNQTFVTSVFSYSCDGRLSIGLPGIVPFKVGVKDDKLYGQPILDQFNPGESDSERLRKRVIDDASRLAIALTRYYKFDQRVPLFAPQVPQVTQVTEVTELVDTTRCPRKPFGAEASVKEGAPPSVPNGCGGKFSSIFTPDFDFGQCCDSHDLCFDDCTSPFSKCSDDFSTCVNNRCDEKYGGSGFNNLLRWGCNNLAHLYAFYASGTWAKTTFIDVTSERCTCGCPANMFECHDGCRFTYDDPENCGSCGHRCGENSFCEFDTCYELPPPSSDPCASQNWYYYSSVDALPAGDAAQSLVVADVNDKYECCRACYTTTRGGKGGCLAYTMEQRFNLEETTRASQTVYDNKCHILVQGAEMANRSHSLAAPWPAQCPFGGAPVNFSGMAAGGTKACDQCDWGYEPSCFIESCMDSTDDAFEDGIVFKDVEPGNCAIRQD